MTQRQPKFGEVWLYEMSEPLHLQCDKTDNLAPLAAAVGVAALVTEDVQIIHPRDLSDLGLRNFLEIGYGISDAQTQSLAGYTPVHCLAILRAGAFGPDGITLTPTDDAMLIGVFTEADAAPPNLAPLPSEGAKGIIAPPPGKPAKSDARIGGMVATVALLVMFALVALMVWIGG